MMSKSDQSGDKQNSAVGYGRPPVNRQFKPGQSGNPRGRPKGSKNLATMFAKALNEKIKVRAKDGRTRMLTTQELMVKGMVNKAVAGDPKAFATVVQFADKFEAHNRLTVNHTEIGNSALEQLQRRLAEMGHHQRNKKLPRRKNRSKAHLLIPTEAVIEWICIARISWPSLTR